MSGSTEIITFTDLEKSFGRTQALAGVDLSIQGGEVLGLVGANGAGKSTLLRIITGTVSRTAGTMSLDGLSVDLSHYHPRMAQDAGIHCVYQELSLCSNLTVAENFELSRSHSLGRSRAEVLEAATNAINEVFPAPGFGPRAYVESLRHAQRQMVEIARAATQPGLRLLILDEPTSALSSERVAQFHEFLRRCKERSIGVIYVTHKLDEVLSISDRIVALRSGRKVWDVRATDASRAALVEHLGGVSMASVSDGSPGPLEVSDQGAQVMNRAPLVEVASVKYTGNPHWSGAPFVVREGEVVGVAGLEGSGQKELLRDIFFSRHKRSDNGVVLRTPAAYVSGDRKREAVFPMWSIADNIALTGLRSFASRLGVIRTRQVHDVVDRWFAELGIVARSPESRITELSGGNQQKAVIARGLASDAQLLIMDDPTRGVDLETKESVYALLRDLKSRDRAAIYYSTEDAEFRYCDRVYVLAGGQIVHELVGPDEISPENIIAWSYRGLEKVPV
ncbi:MAG: sugar ABC transporter ATP-binding protein [Acidobacteria bacterium]|nr:sugar ABC transporter ATP-binding protein [Acidobacteriota bacterium]